MSNLESAKAAIEAELSQAKQGLAHYQSLIDALTEALEQLSGIDGGGTRTSSAGKAAAKRQPKAEKAKAIAPAKKTKAVKPVKPAKSVKGANDLPSTGGTYWTDLINAEPQSGAEILHAAISSLSFTPSKDQVQKLTNRLTFALHSLVKEGKIKDSGSGRERRFFKD